MQLPDDVYSIIRHILTKVECTHADHHIYLAAMELQDSICNGRFFPAWPMIRGPAKYVTVADSAIIARESDDC